MGTLYFLFGMKTSWLSHPRKLLMLVGNNFTHLLLEVLCRAEAEAEAEVEAGELKEEERRM